MEKFCFHYIASGNNGDGSHKAISINQILISCVIYQQYLHYCIALLFFPLCTKTALAHYEERGRATKKYNSCAQALLLPDVFSVCPTCSHTLQTLIISQNIYAGAIAMSLFSVRSLAPCERWSAISNLSVFVIFCRWISVYTSMLWHIVLSNVYISLEISFTFCDYSATIAYPV